MFLFSISFLFVGDMDYAVFSDFLSSDEVATLHMEWISYIPAELAIDWKYFIIIYSYVLSYAVCGSKSQNFLYWYCSIRDTSLV